MSKILIVDDSGLARRTLRQFLEEMGHTVECRKKLHILSEAYA
jgi:CheY-like chemotaxis protein